VSEILLFAIFGFVAQLIDGSLGMGYGVTVSSFLLSIGVSPLATSASVHASEIFTSGVSGLFHLKFGNVNRALFRRLVLPGILGGALGAYLVTSIPAHKIKPFVAAYLLLMGVAIVVRAFRNTPQAEAKTNPALLGLVGGFLDAVGGGGWGPIVTSTLVAKGNHPRLSIGSVNLAEFFVTVAQSAVFFASLGLTHLKIVIGLTLGGVIAAPVAAYATRRMPTQALMAFVGILIIVLSLRTLAISLGTPAGA
jgi:uncharacterized membrane protein YfcA